MNIISTRSGQLFEDDDGDDFSNLVFGDLLHTVLHTLFLLIPFSLSL